jgi:hypothetical protein
MPFTGVAHLAYACKYLTLGASAYGTGIENHHVGGIRGSCHIVASRAQTRLSAFRIRNIHLAAKCLYINAWFHAPFALLDA